MCVPACRLCQMSILLLFEAGHPLTLSEILDRLSKGVSYSVSDKWTLCKLVNAALLSLTAARHAILLASKPATMTSAGLSGVPDSLPYDSDTCFRVNLEFSSPSKSLQLHRVTAVDEDLSAYDRTALMTFRRSVMEAMVVQAVKGKGHIGIPVVIANVRSRLADRFDVTDAVRTVPCAPNTTITGRACSHSCVSQRFHGYRFVWD